MKFFAAILLFTIAFSGLAQSPASSNAAASDFAQLGRYRTANVSLKARVVFLGDSITDYWGSRNGTWFPYAGWINRGIGGQTTSQLLLREQNDAIALHPQAVVLEGGGNDMRLGFSPEEIRENFLSMGELAEQNHIAVFITQMTPVCDCVRPLTGLRTVERIRQLNLLLAAMCKKHDWTLIDINTPVTDSKGHMQAILTVDGVHPNDAGYRLLAPVIERALVRYR